MHEVSLLLITAALATCLKVLLIPSYTSTDFEVHRNWLAITHSLPYQRWYFESTSEWTLDYPPFFAWFEWALSQAAVYVDAAMLDITNLNYKSDLTLYFQRATVILTDFLLVYAGYKCTGGISKTSSKSFIFVVLLIFNCGLFIVDHIHFQYNGFLFGILFLSIANLIHGNVLWSGFWFSVLLNFKHIFLYVAPAYGVFFLRTCCIDHPKISFGALKSFSFAKLFSLSFIVVSVFSASFAPFIDSLGQVLSRLFPFKRGLTHAYWAPNFWALYNGADKVLMLGGKHFGLTPGNLTSSSTSGLVQTVEHAVLPSVPPILTFLLTFIAMIPCLIDIFFRLSELHSERINQFLRAVVLCSLSSFMFGWHVHEKAILMAILPFTLLAATGTQKDAEIFLFLQTVGHYSLFPLLFTPFETVVKVCLVLLYCLFAFGAFGNIYKHKSKWSLPLIGNIETIYLYGLIANEIYCSVIHPLTPFAKRFEFLPLMLTSVYCAFGVTWSWLKLYAHALTSAACVTLKKERKYKR